MATERRKCFVILPFSQTTDAHAEAYWAAHFEKFLKPLIEENDALEAQRSTALRGDIVKAIITDLIVSPVVVADLTDANSNVYWELGVRQSFKHGTVTIAERGTRLPFDIGAKGTLFYDPKDHVQLEGFRRDFKAALADCVSHPDRPDSHVLETISGRGSIYELVRRDEAMRRIDALFDECTHNKEYWLHIVKTVKQNKKDPKKREFGTDVLRNSASELLVTTHYLEQDKAFYRFVHVIFGTCAAVNGQLGVWEQSPESTEAWLLMYENEFTKRFEQFATTLEEVRVKLERQF